MAASLVSSRAAQGAPLERWLALDRLRALAVILMVQGHTFSALLADGELTGPWQRLHTLVHGLTAPTFLFGAGLAFGVTTYATYERHHRGGSVLRDRLRRYGSLVLIGYALQLPGGSLWSAVQLRGEALSPLFRVGPLQLVALTLSVTQLATLLLPTARRHALAAVGTAAIVLAATAPLWRSGVSSELGGFLGAFVDGRGGSLFPAFPWASFALLGVAAWGLLREHPRYLGRWPFVIAGASLAGGTYAAFEAGLIPFDAQYFWHTSPAYVLFRLGLVLIVLGVLHRTSDVRIGAGASTGISALLSRRSLVAYVTHLLVLYGTPITPNLTRSIGRTLSLPLTTLAFVALMSLTIAVAYAWERLERARALTPRRVELGFAVLGLVILSR